MSAKESYSGEGGRRLTDASKLILLDEYRSLLGTVEPMRVLNRALLIAMVLFQLIYAPVALLYQVALLIAAALASCFWFLQEFSMGRRLNRLGELIASTSGELIVGMKAGYSRPVVLPIVKRESQTTPPSSLAQVAASTEASEPSDQIWTDAYVSWRNEARNNRWLHAFQRSEPVVWFTLALVVGIYRALLALH